MQVEQLIDLAKTLLNFEGQEDLRLEMLEQYCAEFAEWFADNRELLEANDNIDVDKLRELECEHNKVLELAKSWQGAVAGDLRKLKVKGKGIIAYTDILPKRLSQMRPTKG